MKRKLLSLIAFMVSWQLSSSVLLAVHDEFSRGVNNQGQQPAGSISQESQNATAEKPDLVRATSLLGSDTLDQQYKHVGVVDDMVLDLPTSKVTHLMLDDAPVPGETGSLVAVNANALGRRVADREYLLNIDPRDLRDSKTFPQNQWPQNIDLSQLELPASDSDSSRRGQTPGKDGEVIPDPASIIGRAVNHFLQNPSKVPATQLIGAKVRNKEKEELGKIEDFVLDLKSQQVRYAVLNTKGPLGNRDKWVAVPLNRMTHVAGEQELELDVSLSELQRASGFSHRSWPMEPDVVFTGETQKEPERMAQSESKLPEMYQISTLIGRDIKTQDNRMFGEIYDLVVNVSEGSILQLIVSPQGEFGSRDQLLAIQPSSLSQSWVDERTFVVLLSGEELNRLPAVSRADWPHRIDLASLVQDWSQQTVRSPEPDLPQGGTVISREPESVRRYYESARPSQRGSRFLTIRELVGMEVLNRIYEPIGTIRDGVASLATGDMPFLLMDAGEIIGVRDRVIALVPQQLMKPADRNALITSMTREQLQKAPGFERTSWPNVTEHAWVQRVREYYGMSYQSTQPIGGSRSGEERGFEDHE